MVRPKRWSNKVVEYISLKPKIAQKWHKDNYPKAIAMIYYILCHFCAIFGF